MGNKTERTGLTEIHALCADLGLTMPKDAGKIIRIRQGVVNCAEELNKKYNFNGFKDSLISMFKEFGIVESEYNDSRKKNREDWEMWYDSWHWPKHTLNLVDAQILTKNRGYANIFLRREIDLDNNQVINVFPGPCCFPSFYNATFGRPPVKYFYEICERIIGADPDMGRYNEQTELKAFIVRDHKYKLVPYRTAS